MSLNDYEMIGKLGSGSFGVVHKARDKTKNLVCVIKMVDIAKMDTKMRKNAMAEGRILKQINSPYIVKHFNTFITKSTLNIVMEYCPKGDLTNFLKAQMGKPLKEDIIWKMAIQMMIGLRDLHSQKILHRDIKAMNIFLDGENNVRIGDLGVARVLKSDFAHTIVGTPYYLSPEMCEEKPYNQKTDIWAMGCVIYQLCTGKHPFDASNQAALALKIVMGKYNPIPPHYSADLGWVVQTCLSVDYKRRPTASYLLNKQKIIQKAEKLGIELGPEKEEKVKEEVKPKVEQKVKEVKQSKSVYEKLGQNKQRNKSGAKQSSVEQKKQWNRSASKQRKNIQNQSREKKNINSQIRSQKHPPSRPVPIPKSVRSNHINKSEQPHLNYLSRLAPKQAKKKKSAESEPTVNKIEIVDSDDSDEKQKNNTSPKKNKLLIIQQAQKAIKDDELEKQFGITPEKKEVLASFELKKTKTINWDIEDEIKQKCPEEKKQSLLPQRLPTVRTKSNMQPVAEVIIHDEYDDQGQVMEEIEDNVPYISDDESAPEEEQLLIEDYEQKEGDYSKKIIENEKRKKQLEKLKKHFEEELLKKVSKDEYGNLMKKLTKFTEQEVNEMVKAWNNIETINIFYRIVHFNNEINRCQMNISVLNERLESVRKNR